MKKRYVVLFTCLLAFVCVNAHAQEGKAIGRIVYEIGVNNPSYIEMWFNSSGYMYQVRKTGRQQEMTALNGPRRFASAEDSIEYAKKERMMKELLNDNPVQIFYGKIGESRTIFSGFIGEDHKKYCVTDSLSFIDWKIVEDTLTIDGLLCQKATGLYKGVTYTAWFATSIPVSGAPMYFRGLPGLLIKSINEKSKSSMRMLEMEMPLKQSIVIAPCTGADVITKTEFIALGEKHNAEVKKMIDYYKEQLDKKKRGEVGEVKMINQSNK